MPYLHLSVQNPLTAEEKHELCESIGPLMPLLPGKTRQNTMMHIEDSCTIELGDASPCLFLEVRMFKASPEDAKQAFVKAISDLLEKKLSVPKNRMYINLTELDSWGSNGAIKH